MGPCHHVMERHQAAEGGERRPDTEGTCEYNKWAVADCDKRRSSGFGVGRGANNSSPKSQCVIKCYTGLQTRTDHLGRLKQCQINLISKHGMVVSIRHAHWTEIKNYRRSEGTQAVLNQKRITLFSCGKGNEDHQLRVESFVHNRIASTFKWVEFVRDRIPYTVLRSGVWMSMS